MVDYNSPEQIQRLTIYRNAQSLVLLGIVSWEIIITLPFDWSIITRKRKARWPMFAYFIARISMFFHVLSLTVNSHGHEIISCDAQVWIMKITDATAIWSSSLLLALRTIAVWSKDKRVVFPICVCFAALIVVYCLTWQPSVNVYKPNAGCIILKSVPHYILLTEFLYTFIFDLIITVLMVVKLWAWRHQGGLSSMLLQNGIGYFAFASVGNLIQAIMPALALSGLMNVLFLPVAMTISVIASTRVFIRLLTHADPHNTYTSHTGAERTGTAALAPSHYQPSRLGQVTTGGGVEGGAFPAAPGFDQPYGLNTVKNPRHRITIQTHTAMVDDKNNDLDLEYGGPKKSEYGDDDSYKQSAHAR